MRPPAQTRLSHRLTVSQMARVGEIECLIIIICRRLSTNLEKNDAIRVCEYLLSRQERRGRLTNGADWQSHTLITSSVNAQRRGIRQRYIDTDGGSSFKQSEERGSNEPIGG